MFVYLILRLLSMSILSIIKSKKQKKIASIWKVTNTGNIPYIKGEEVSLTQKVKGSQKRT